MEFESILAFIVLPYFIATFIGIIIAIFKSKRRWVDFFASSMAFCFICFWLEVMIVFFGLIISSFYFCIKVIFL